MRIRSIWIISLAAAMACGGSVSADILNLSTFSSEPNQPAELLDAVLDFTVTGNELQLVVSNDTNTNSPPAEYEIGEIGFNAASEVTDLQLTGGPAGWTLLFDQDPPIMHLMDGFGKFDARLMWDTAGMGPTILPGTSETFTFGIRGAGFSAGSFVSDFSVAPPGRPMLAAALFFRGPGDDSAFGAVPEPGSLALLTVGVLLAARRR